MFGVALFILVYFPTKFLGRPYDSHITQQGAATSLLAIYVTSRLGIGAWDAAGRVVRGGWVLVRDAALAVALLLVALVVVDSPRNAVDALPARIRPAAAADVSVPRLGYSLDPAGDPYLLTDVGTLLDSAGLGVHDVFDFSNNPAVFYYLLPYESPTRFLHISMAIPDESQAMVIDELAQTSPAVVVFDSSDGVGLPTWDDVANQVRHDDVSAWVLDHYQPWVSSHGYTFLQRNDLELRVPSANGPEPGREFRTGDLLVSTRDCAWGMAPSYLDWELPPGPGLPLSGDTIESVVTITGWVVASPDAAQPTRVTVVAANGTEIGSATPTVARPDVVAARATGDLTSGFGLTVGLAEGEDPQQLRLAITDSKGGTTVTEELATRSATVDGLTYHVEGLDIATSVGPPVRRVQIQQGPQSRTDWLVLDSGASTPEVGAYQMSGSAWPNAGQLISFETNESSPTVQGIRLDSCAQWHGFERTVYVSAPSLAALDQLSLRTG